MLESHISEKLSIKAESVKSLRDIAVESLREAIVMGHLKPGQHIKEREISSIMGISTTPIKEALRILGHEGLVETFPRRGSYVSKVVDSSIEEILMLRAALDALCSRLAALKITDEKLLELEQQIILIEDLYKQNKVEDLVKENTVFHNKIRQAANNPMILNILKNIAAFDTAFRKRALKFTVEMEEGFHEHREIFEAIKDRDHDLAEERMKNHIMRSTQWVLSNQNELDE
jgi:DNA-binding GntR family transcriptional regulator